MKRPFGRALLGLVLLAAVAPVAPPARATLPGGTPARIIFVSNRSGNSDIFSMRSDGTDLKQLTVSPVDDIHPSVSPDGQTIAFSSNRSNGYDLWLMNADGSNQRRITSDGQTIEIDPAWSPDGTKIAHMRNVGQQFDIFTVAADGTSAVNLTNTPDSNEADIAWAGDNSAIAFASDIGKDFEIYTMKPDGTARMPLTENAEDDFVPDWAPDSSSIAFTTWRNGNADIYEMDPDGSNERPLIKTKDNESWASHSPDGKQLLFARQTGTISVERRFPNGFLPAQNNDETDIKELFIYYFGFDFWIQMTDRGDSFNGDGGWIPTYFACAPPEVEGYFEPVQGVWQDDDFFKQFDKTPNLLQVTQTEYLAQLPMVQGRKSLLFGVREPKNGPLRNDRYNIVIRGKVSGTTEVPVHMKFTELTNGKVIYTSPDMWKVKLDPPCGPPTEFETKLPAPSGIPPDAAFTFGAPGDYVIRNELIRSDGGGTGMLVDVGGTTVATTGPRLLFVPLLTKANTAADQQTLIQDTKKLKDAVQKFTPDYLPLAQGPNAIPASVRSPLDISTYLAEGAAAWDNFATAIRPGGGDTLDQVRLARVDQFFRFTAMTGAYDRVVAVLRRPDLTFLRGYEVNGNTPSQKVILVASDVNHFTVSHELTHSSPYLWSSDQMAAECGYDYHNKSAEQVAHGYQVTLGGVENRAAKDPFNHLMAANLDRWTDQCTYWHMSKVLQSIPDPAVLMVQARIGRNGSKVAGDLLPAYQFNEGEIDLDKKGKDDWAIELLSRTGKKLGRYPFTPEWTLSGEPEEERNVMYVSFRLPQVKGVASIRLAGPKGTLDTLRFSDAAPKVTIIKPASNATVTPVDGAVSVAWKGSDKDKDGLLYTLQYSSDGGETWSTQLLETSAKAGSVPLDDAMGHMIRIVVTDGGRSSSDTVAFITP
jgi:hypothetical protein